MCVGHRVFREYVTVVVVYRINPAEEARSALTAAISRMLAVLLTTALNLITVQHVPDQSAAAAKWFQNLSEDKGSHLAEERG